VLRSEKCHELFNVSAGNVSGTSSGIAWLIKDKVLFAHSQSLQARGVRTGGETGIFPPGNFCADAHACSCRRILVELPTCRKPVRSLQMILKQFEAKTNPNPLHSLFQPQMKWRNL